MIALLLLLAGGPAADCPVQFTDVAASSGLALTHDRGGTREHRIAETMGAGLAWLDYDNDGWMDLYVVQGGPFPPAQSPRAQDRLFRNDGHGQFTDVTAKARLNDRAYGMGAFAADYDNDGWVDLLVTNWGGIKLYRNDGDGTFSDVTAKAGLAAVTGLVHGRGLGRRRRGRAAGSFSGALRRRPKREQALLRRPGHRRARLLPAHDVSRHVGTALQQRRRRHLPRRHEAGRPGGLGRPGARRGLRGRGPRRKARPLRRQRRDRQLPLPQPRRRALRGHRGPSRARHSTSQGNPQGGMGIDAGDLDGDGLPDLVVANFENETNEYYRNLGSGVFEDLSVSSGFGPPAINFVGFGLNLLDVENDGDLDAFIANGHIFERPTRQGTTYPQRPFLMWNDGTGHFRERGCGSAFAKALRRPRLGRRRLRQRRRPRRRGVQLRRAAPAPAQRRREEPLGRGPARRPQVQPPGHRRPAGRRDARRARSSRGSSWPATATSPPPTPACSSGSGPRRSIRKLTIFWPSGTVQTRRRPRGRQVPPHRGERVQARRRPRRSA